MTLSLAKPLSSQIQREFIESTNISKEKICLLTGLITPNKRKKRRGQHSKSKQSKNKNSDGYIKVSRGQGK